VEKKLIALVFVGVLAGLVGGYGLGYFIYQPQVQNLQTDMNSLKDDLNNLKNRTWHEAYSIQASSDLTSGTIQLKGSSVRVMWIAKGDYSSAWLSIQLHFYNGTPYAVWGSSGVWTANNAVLELTQTGNYYLNITTYDTEYHVSVWDYY
jgi:hypothetical protein